MNTMANDSTAPRQFQRACLLASALLLILTVYGGHAFGNELPIYDCNELGKPGAHAAMCYEPVKVYTKEDRDRILDEIEKELRAEGKIPPLPEDGQEKLENDVSPSDD